MENLTLPIINLDHFKPDSNDNDEFLAKLRQVTHEIGFFYLTEAAFPLDLAEQLLASARKFFALDENVKRQIDIANSLNFRGYTPIGEERTQNIIDWREQLDIAHYEFDTAQPDHKQPWDILEGPNQWPKQVPELQSLSEQWIKYAEKTAKRLLGIFAQALGQDKDVFTPAFTNAFSAFKIVHYPAHDGSITAQGVGEHRDSGALTLLYLEPNSTGLQVKYQDSWIDVQPLARHFVINIGELLEIATSGYLKSTPHRVLASKVGTSRLSLPFFLNSALNKSIPTLTLPENLAKQANGIGLDSHGSKMYATYGLNALKWRLRSHPSVVQRHYQQLAKSFLSDFTHS